MTGDIKQTILTQQQIYELEYNGGNPPSKYYVINASGDYHFFHTRNRLVAKDASEDVYGKGKYAIKNWFFNK